MSKPSLPRGTRDFGPKIMAKRNYIFSTIRAVFQRYGFEPLETPSMEQLSVLTGKYGDEGDQLIFKILNSGDFLSEVEKNELAYKAIKSIGPTTYKEILPSIAEKALRYDLTVPFARYVVMNRNDITFPFKRYQMQPVWRADRPQKGRYREFYQCDADVVGTNSLFCESELVLMADEVLSKLGLKDFTIQINNRKILSGLAEAIGETGKEGIICVAIDKLDKIGEEGVQKELLEKGISEKGISELLKILKTTEASISIKDQLSGLGAILAKSENGKKGISEVYEVLLNIDSFNLSNAKVVFNLALARGLSYYTGCIFEIKAGGVQIGSISGGGRYDNLTGVFGLPGVSGVGISFGVDRLFDVLEELQLFPESVTRTTDVLITAFDPNAFTYGFGVLAKLRSNGIHAELYPEPIKIKKQLDYADAKKIPYVVLIGSEEIETDKLTFKNMTTGLQEKLTVEGIMDLLKNNQ
jgi:histidyl-tRNA synthetase